MKPASSRTEILQGTLDLLISRSLLFGPAHGHRIAKHIQRTSEDALTVETGSLHPALHRPRRKPGSAFAASQLVKSMLFGLTGRRYAMNSEGI